MKVSLAVLLILLILLSITVPLAFAGDADPKPGPYPPPWATKIPRPSPTPYVNIIWSASPFGLALPLLILPRTPIHGQARLIPLVPRIIHQFILTAKAAPSALRSASLWEAATIHLIPSVMVPGWAAGLRW